MISSREFICAPAQFGGHSLSTQAILAGFIMSDDGNETKGRKPSMKADFDPDTSSRPFFREDDFDIYVNKLTNETYIFHGPELPYPVERLDYDPEECRISVVTKSGQIFDLGVKIQWLIRPYLTEAKTVFIIQTKDGETVDGVEVPLVVKETQQN